ncbi:MAG TPA: HlyC/CorC family transporter [Alphaproteobacteria bacterium]|nr:HlyC/CorC family transporter [Alphaproteobacteria bacterium]
MTTAHIVPLAVIAIMLVLSAFFSGSETALTAASRSRLHHLEREGNRRARLAAALLKRRERLIGTILLGNNAVNISASALATGVLIAALGDNGVFYATITMTLLILVFGEILPKTYALRHADRLALLVAPVMRVLVWLLAPIVIAIEAIVSATLHLFGIGMRVQVSRDDAEEELRGAISLHARAGRFVKQEHDMLHGILDLSDTTIGQVMVHRRTMLALDARMEPARLIDEVLNSPYTRFPLWQDEPDNIVGVIHAKDLLRAMHDRQTDFAAIDILKIASRPWFVLDSTTLRDQLLAFRQRRAHVALVVDEYGALQGLVTLEDILEEIVGDILDEFDVKLHGIQPQPDGSYLVPGATPIRDLNRELNWTLPDEGATTIAGLVIEEAQALPEVGQSFLFHGLRFKVERRQRNQIALLRITPWPSEERGPPGA